MADLYIENEYVKAGINIHGAELRSLIRKSDEREYMWCGDAKYWNRVSPVLFPFVGKLNKLKYTFKENTYENIPQHGFARDCDFTVVSHKDTEIWFSLTPDTEFKSHFPLDFILEIGYRLEEKKVHVMWKVTNPSTDTLYFSIGAHPAFLCPESGLETESKEGYLLDLGLSEDTEEILSGVIDENGLLISGKTRHEKLDNGRLTLTEKLFDDDALVIDSEDIHDVTFLTPEKTPYLSVHFDTPLLGIWSPAKKKAPFVCIEPWYGRCDRNDFTGTLEEREYGNILQKDEVFDKEYVIEIL